VNSIGDRNGSLRVSGIAHAHLKQSIVLTQEERAELEGHVRAHSLRVSNVRRATHLLLGEGCSYDHIRVRLECNREFITRCKRRFCEAIVAVLHTCSRVTRSYADPNRIRVG
jgi:hypothetical protein